MSFKKGKLKCFLGIKPSPEKIAPYWLIILFPPDYVKREPKKVCLVQRYWYKEVSIYIHPTYNRWTSDLQSWTSDPQKLSIRHTKVEHPTYIKVEHPTYKSWTSDLQRYVQPTNQYFYQNIRPTGKKNIRPTHLRTRTSDLQSYF